MFWLEQLGMLIASVRNFTQRLFYIRSYRNNRDAPCAFQWRGGCSPNMKFEVTQRCTSLDNEVYDGSETSIGNS